MILILMLLQVIGVPDERLGEQIAAWIRLRDGETCTEQEIKDFCKGKASGTDIYTVLILSTIKYLDNIL